MKRGLNFCIVNPLRNNRSVLLVVRRHKKSEFNIFLSIDPKSFLRQESIGSKIDECRGNVRQFVSLPTD